MQRMSSIVLMVIALGMVAYHLISTHLILQPYAAHINTHVGFCLVVVFLAGLVTAKGKKRLWYLCLAVLSLLAFVYVEIWWEQLQERAFFCTATDLAIGALLIVLTIEATRQHFGLAIPILVLIAVIYPFLGQHLPEPLYTRAIGLEDTISHLSISLGGKGVIGHLPAISLYYVFLFVVFGGLLQATGATRFFLSLAKLVAGRVRGAPALIAVISSALVGSISGSVFANVAITGSFTIPLMKRMGYKSEQAGAVEAAASSGGQIMPPVMGIGAFIMAGMTNVPYIQICIMAILPAIIYYLCIGLYTYIRAGQLNIGTMRTEDEKGNTRELLLEAPKFVIPLAAIVGVLVAGYSVMYAAFCGIISLILISLIRRKTRPSLDQIIDGLVKGAVTGAGIGASIACVSMMVATFTLTGLGIEMSYGIEQWSGGYLLVTLVIIWTVCILLGMGGLGFTTYIIISIFGAPALIRMGVSLMQAHFFIFFASVFNMVTPPIASAAIIASKLAGARYMKTALETGKIAAAGLLLPLVFIYAPAILLQPVDLVPEVVIIIGFIIALTALQVGMVGYYFRECNILERILVTASAALLMVFIVVQNYILFAIGTGLFTLVTLRQWRKPRF